MIGNVCIDVLGAAQITRSALLSPTESVAMMRAIDQINAAAGMQQRQPLKESTT